ncbi:unnamed protein product [Auanema sp. JU1783]|nr:unnamed protein product [Auanema sp. JU1783]
MARHRLINKKYYEEDFEDDDYDYGSPEDEIAMSPSIMNQYVLNRNSDNSYSRYQSSSNDHAEAHNTGVESSDGLLFSMDDVGGEETVSMARPPGLPEPKPKPSGASNQKQIGKPCNPNISNLKVAEIARSTSKSPSRKKNDGASNSRCSTPTQAATLTSNSSSHRLAQLSQITQQSTPKRERKVQEQTKDLINLVVVGHVDAGKSTLMGHFLVQHGNVEQRLVHKYKQDAGRAGKASFAFAWVLDETEEERSRGVTMDIARTSFDTETKRVHLLDAPGHKDFIPNMITGASQANSAILVVNATVGEFETGFANGGQTKEHAMLLRSLGVSQLIVAINQLDRAEWSRDRFEDVKHQLNSFLTKMAGFSNVKYIPLSGLSGENLVKRFEPSHPASTWYQGECLLELIDKLQPPKRSAEGSLRIVVNDVMKSMANTITISGKLESGEVENGDKVYIMPNADAAVVKSCTVESRSDGTATAGDDVLMTLTGTFEPDTHHAGDVVVRGGEDTLIPARRFRVRLMALDITIPIMKGTKAELYCHSLCEPCTIVKIVSSLNKTTGEVLKNKPRCLSRHMHGIVEIETDHDVAIEAYTNCKALGRIALRCKGETIAAGIVEKSTTVIKGN